MVNTILAIRTRDRSESVLTRHRQHNTIAYPGGTTPWNLAAGEGGRASVGTDGGRGEGVPGRHDEDELEQGVLVGLSAGSIQETLQGVQHGEHHICGRVTRGTAPKQRVQALELGRHGLHWRRHGCGRVQSAEERQQHLQVAQLLLLPHSFPRESLALSAWAPQNRTNAFNVCESTTSAPRQPSFCCSRTASL